MNEELMNVAEEAVEEVVVSEACSKVGFGKGMLIAAGVVGAGVVLYKLGKKVVSNIKAKKNAESEDYNEDSGDEKENN